MHLLGQDGGAPSIDHVHFALQRLQCGHRAVTVQRLCMFEFLAQMCHDGVFGALRPARSKFGPPIAQVLPDQCPNAFELSRIVLCEDLSHPCHVFPEQKIFLLE